MSIASHGVTPDYAAPTTPGPGKGLFRMPLVWVAILIPAGFVLAVTFLMPSL